MVRTIISKALIIDHNAQRAGEISRALTRAGVHSNYRELAVLVSGAGCSVNNLWGAQTELPVFDILFIHLGPPEKLRKKRMYGNECAMEFVALHKGLLENHCIIAYSGGNDPEPAAFKRVYNPCWHKFFNLVSGASALQIVPFIHIWNRNPNAPPPLKTLTHRSETVGLFKLMIGNYRQDYDRANTEADRQKLRESFENPEKWAVLFPENSADDDLLQRLEWAGEGHALRAAAALKAWVSTPKGGGSPPCFDETLRNTILEVRPWQAHFQDPSS